MGHPGPGGTRAFDNTAQVPYVVRLVTPSLAATAGGKAAIGAGVDALAKGAMQAMFWTTLKAAAGVLAGAAILGDSGRIAAEVAAKTGTK